MDRRKCYVRSYMIRNIIKEEKDVQGTTLQLNDFGDIISLLAVWY